MSDTKAIRRKIEDLITAAGVEAGYRFQHIASGETIAANEDALYPTASVFKVPVMAEVYRQAGAGRFQLSDRLTLDKRHKTLSSGVLQTLDDGIAPTIRDLCVLMTIISDNTATAMLLELVGIDNVNAHMASLGLDGIHVSFGVHQMFLHAWGLSAEDGETELRRRALHQSMDYASTTFARTRESTVATARAACALMVLLAEGTVVSKSASRDMISILRDAQLNNRVARCLPWGAVAHKGGTMRGLRNDIGIIQRSREDRIAYAIFSFDWTVLPGNNSEILVGRDATVDGMMADIGRVLWNEFALAGRA